MFNRKSTPGLTPVATMPERFLRQPEDLIGGMRIGDSGYAVSWALSVAENGTCWLRSDYSIHATPGGTVQLLIQRRQDGYHVTLPAYSDYVWDREDDLTFHDTPVVKVTY